MPADQRARIGEDCHDSGRIHSQRGSANGSETRCSWALPECCWQWSRLLLDREQFLRSYLFAYLYWTGMALGCLAILLMHHVVGGQWGMIIRRLCEAGARTLPLMALLLIPVLFGIRHSVSVGAAGGVARRQHSEQSGLSEHSVLRWPRGALLRRLVLCTRTC